MKIRDVVTRNLPKDFVWGTATSSYQIEGGFQSGIRGRCIWDDLCDVPDAIRDGTKGGIGIDHVERLEEDLDLLKWMGINSYRFSISWPRVQLTGRGNFNQAGIDFYHRLIDGLLKRGIEPNITLYHWDLPSELQSIGGWSNPHVVDLFVEYTEKMAREYGSKVKYWSTLNEPWCTTYLGHLIGEHAPGIKDLPTTVKVAHQLVRAHALASKAIKLIAPSVKVGVVLNLADQRFIGQRSDSIQKELDIVDSIMNLWWLQGMFEGRYPKNLIDVFEDLTGLHIDESEIPNTEFGRDWLGLNYYAGQVFAPGGAGFGLFPGTKELAGAPWGTERTDIGWSWTPDGLKNLLVRLNEMYPNLPIFITENGACYNNVPDEFGKVDDAKRQEYMALYIQSAIESIDAGVNLRGYYAWSMWDNFEWAFGFSMRFGLVYVDFDSLKRIVKESGHQYRELITRL